jgi:hypothetical protein
LFSETCWLWVRMTSINGAMSVSVFCGIYVDPHMRTISLCVRGLPICEFFWIPTHSHMGTPRVRTHWRVSDLKLSHAWTRIFWLRVRTHRHTPTSKNRYCR